MPPPGFTARNRLPPMLSFSFILARHVLCSWMTSQVEIPAAPCGRRGRNREEWGRLAKRQAGYRTEVVAAKRLKCIFRPFGRRCTSFTSSSNCPQTGDRVRAWNPLSRSPVLFCALQNATGVSFRNIPVRPMLAKWGRLTLQASRLTRLSHSIHCGCLNSVRLRCSADAQTSSSGRTWGHVLIDMAARPGRINAI